MLKKPAAFFFHSTSVYQLRISGVVFSLEHSMGRYGKVDDVKAWSVSV
jgi:hypothetical protein